MTDTGQCEARPEEIAESRRRCWAGDCRRTARLEWCGWRYCFRHYWSHIVCGHRTWQEWWWKVKYTEIARHRIR